MLIIMTYNQFQLHAILFTSSVMEARTTRLVIHNSIYEVGKFFSPLRYSVKLRMTHLKRNYTQTVHIDYRLGYHPFSHRQTNLSRFKSPESILLPEVSSALKIPVGCKNSR